MKITWNARLRLWITLSAAFMLAILSGHMMQKSRNDPVVEALAAAVVVVPRSPVISVSLQTPPSPGERIVNTRADRGETCAPSLELRETPGGMLDIAFHAACHRAQPIEITVNDLVATARTDAHGSHLLRLPALADTVEVHVGFGEYALSETLTFSKEVEAQHVILAWSGVQTFSLRTTTYASPADAGRTVPLLQTAPVGVLTQVGAENGHAFEVLSFPTKPASAKGVVRLTVDAEVTQSNCGQAVSTLAYQTGYSGKLRRTEIAYTMPDCDRIGDVVRLQNLFRDMRLAAR